MQGPGRLAGLREGRIDFHTHAIDPDLPTSGLFSGGRFPRVKRTGPNTAQIILDDRVYRTIDETCWSTAARLRDMDRDDVAVQVLSPVPVTLCHDQSVPGAVALARAQNDFLAAMVASAPDRFRALGAVPMQDPPRAVEELTRCVSELGFVGVEIGTRVAGLELADPRFTPFFEAASALSAVIFVHPVDQDLDQRLTGMGLGFGIGMPTETAIGAASLLSTGITNTAPSARFVLAHGAGALPALLPRLDCGRRLTVGGEDVESFSAAARRIWCDSLTYDLASLQLAIARFGADHVVLGTDYPFAAREQPAGAVLQGLDPALQLQIGVTNACTLCSNVG